jgi:hypothetical protein
MDKSGYGFRIQRAQEDIKYFKQRNHCRPVLLKQVVHIVTIAL